MTINWKFRGVFFLKTSFYFTITAIRSSSRNVKSNSLNSLCTSRCPILKTIVNCQKYLIIFKNTNSFDIYMYKNQIYFLFRILEITPLGNA